MLTPHEVELSLSSHSAAKMMKYLRTIQLGLEAACLHKYLFWRRVVAMAMAESLRSAPACSFMKMNNVTSFARISDLCLHLRAHSRVRALGVALSTIIALVEEILVLDAAHLGQSPKKIGEKARFALNGHTFEIMGFVRALNGHTFEITGRGDVQIPVTGLAQLRELIPSAVWEDPVHYTTFQAAKGIKKGGLLPGRMVAKGRSKLVDVHMSVVVGYARGLSGNRCQVAVKVDVDRAIELGIRFFLAKADDGRPNGVLLTPDAIPPEGLEFVTVPSRAS